MNCPPVLIIGYIDWCQAVGRPVPVVAVSFNPDLLRRLSNESSIVCVGSVDPFSALEYFVQRLKRVRHQVWLLNLPQLRLCLESGVVPFESLCGVLQGTVLVQQCVVNEEVDDYRGSRFSSVC